MEELKNEIGKPADVECWLCGHQTVHTILAAYKSTWTKDGMQAKSVHHFYRCNGCQMGTYRIEYGNSEEPDTALVQYPPQRLREEKRFYDVGVEIANAYREIITAINNGLLTLASAGVRLVIEGICTEKGIKNGEVLDVNTGKKSRKNSLEGKINGLVEKDFITKEQAKNLHEIRFLGNDAAHELNTPRQRDVLDAIDIVEHMMNQIYDQPVKGKALAKRKRPKKRP